VSGALSKCYEMPDNQSGQMYSMVYCGLEKLDTHVSIVRILTYMYNVL
jgi:hypothetical protein